MAECPRCGAQFDEADDLCHKCGLIPSKVRHSRPKQLHSPPPHKNMRSSATKRANKRLAALSMVLLAIVLVAALHWRYGEADRRKEAGAFLAERQAAELSRLQLEEAKLEQRWARLPVGPQSLGLSLPGSSALPLGYQLVFDSVEFQKLSLELQGRLESTGESVDPELLSLRESTLSVDGGPPLSLKNSEPVKFSALNWQGHEASVSLVFAVSTNEGMAFEVTIPEFGAVHLQPREYGVLASVSRIHSDSTLALIQPPPGSQPGLPPGVLEELTYDATSELYGKALSSLRRAVLEKDRRLFESLFYDDYRRSGGELFARLEVLPLQTYEIASLTEAPEGGIRLRQHLSLEDLPGMPIVCDGILRIFEIDSSYQLGPDRYSNVTPVCDVLLTQRDMALSPTHHFQILSHPAQYQILRAITDHLEMAWLAVFQRLIPIKESYLAVIPPDPRFFGGVRNGQFLAGVATWIEVDTGDGQVVLANQALLLNPLAFVSSMGQESHQETLVHELVHLGLAEWTSRSIPGWMIEGAAVYFSGGFTKKGDPVRLGPSVRRFVLLDWEPPTSLEDYGFAGALVEFLVLEDGVPSFLGFYEAMGKSNGNLSGLLHDHYGMTLEDLKADTLDWLVDMRRLEG